MTRGDAAEIVAMVVSAFPRPQVSERTCEVYVAMLLDLEADAARRAVARLIATSKFMPTVAEIRTAVVELEHGALRLGGEAWGDVGAEIRRVGAYGVPQFADPVAAECVRLLGWRNLCLGTNDAADRARFVELYDGLALRQRADEVAGPSLALPAPVHSVAALAGSIGRTLPEPAKRPSAREQSVGRVAQSNHGKTGLEGVENI